MPLSSAELRADKEVFDIGEHIQVSIVARNYDSERSAFFAGKQNPDFVYHRVMKDLTGIRKALLEVDIPQTPFGTLLHGRAMELVHFIDYSIAQDVTTASEAAQRLYGSPTRALVAQAEQIVNDSQMTRSMVLSLQIPAQEIIAALRKSLLSYQLSGWQAVESKEPSQGLTVASDRKTVEVQRGTTDTLETIPMIVTHEIDTHVLCAENAAVQPTFALMVGLPGWLHTQEGLAAYNVAQQHPKGSKRPIFHWAMRVLAVDKALNGSFRDVFEYLTSLGLEKNYAFATAFRTKRGLPDATSPGAFTRDYIYFSGMHKVMKYIEQGGALRDLYIGRISVEHIEEAKKFDWLLPPKLLPSFVSAAPRSSK